MIIKIINDDNNAFLIMFTKYIKTGQVFTHNDKEIH